MRHAGVNSFKELERPEVLFPVIRKCICEFSYGPYNLPEVQTKFPSGRVPRKFPVNLKVIPLPSGPDSDSMGVPALSILCPTGRVHLL